MTGAVGLLDPRLLTPPARVALVVVAVGALVSTACALTGVGHPVARDVLQNALLLAGALGVAWRAVRVPAQRTAWAVLAVALVSWSAGNLLWSVHYDALEAPPYPSWSDALWLAAYPLYYACLVLLAREHLHRFQSSMWLDGATGVLALGAVGSAVLVGPLSASLGGPPATVATTLAYPLADLLVLALVLAVFALCRWRPGAQWVVLGLGFLLNVVADTALAYLAATGAYEEGGWVDATFVLSLLTLAAAAWLRPRPVPRARLEGLPVLLPPLLFAAIALCLLAVDVVQPGRSAPLAEALVLGTLVAVVVRCFLTFRENAALLVTREQATTDELTGLANRRGVSATTRRALAGAREQEHALLLVDVVRFKDINDTLGHHAGDRLLLEMTARLRAALPDAVVLGRLGGDEFVALLAGGEVRARDAAARLRQAVDAPVALAGLDVPVRVSVGIAVGAGASATFEELLRHADVALHRAKQAGGEVELYRAERDPHTRERLELASDLRRAITRGELVLHFQPKADLATSCVRSVEALVRWQHPTRGLLFPDQFLPLAERGGLMRPLTLQVLDAALRQAAAWRAEGLRLQVAVNLSAANLLDARFPEQVAELLERWRADAGSLQLEITEDTIMVDPARAIGVLDRLGAQGISLSLDDYGTGYSSLAYLKRLPIQELKIDKSFVLHMSDDEDDALIVRSTVELARNLGLRVVAEGVEDHAAWARLAGWGCDVAQGYLLGRPQAPDDVVRGLTRVGGTLLAPVAPAVRAA
jgi:diguanylate cyclase (GGDEF)-like protein